jgi:hypothetical protein
MKVTPGKKDITFLEQVVKMPHIKNMYDFSHTTSEFLSKLAALDDVNQLHVGFAKYINGFDKLLRRGNPGLCVSGHPVMHIKIDNALMVNSFTTISNGQHSGPWVTKVTDIGFDFSGRIQGFNPRGIILPNSGVAHFTSFRAEIGLNKNELLAILQKHIKLYGEDAVMLDIMNTINEEARK